MKKLKNLSRSAEVKPESINTESRCVDLVWSTGASVQRQFCDGEIFNEVLSLRKNSVDLSRLNRGAPFLKDHSRDVDSVLGCVERAWIDEKKGEAWATVRFDADGERYFKKIQDKILRNVSVGYQILELDDVSKEDHSIRTLEASRWIPLEISLVAIGADPHASIRADQEMTEVMIHNLKEREQEVKPIETIKESEKEKISQETELKRELEVRQEERKKVLAIQECARSLGLAHSSVESVLAQNASLERSKSLLLDEYTRTGSTHIMHGMIKAGELDETETRRIGLEQHLLHRSFPEKYELKDQGREYYGMSLLDVAKDCVETMGIRSRGLNKLSVFERAMTTSDYPLLLSNISNKILLNFYELAERTYTPFVTEKEVSDFKPVNPLRVSEIGELRELPEDSEIEATYLTEQGDSYRIKTYARMLHFSLQQMVNDDLGAFTKALSTFGVAAATTEQNHIYDIFIKNLKMGDGSPLFDEGAPHKNVVTVAKDKKLLGDTDQISDGFFKMMDQRSMANNYLSLSPKYLLVPHTLREAALKMVSTNFLATQFTNQNIYGGQFTPIIEPRLSLSAKDAKPKENAYYLLAGKEKIDFIEYAYLSGARGIQTEPQQSFERLGFRVRGVLHFGVKALEYRGAVKIRQDI